MGTMKKVNTELIVETEELILIRRRPTARAQQRSSDMAEVIESTANRAGAAGPAVSNLTFTDRTILAPPFSEQAGWKRWVEHARFPPGLQPPNTRPNPANGDIVVQLAARPAEGGLVFKAGFQLDFTSDRNGFEVFSGLLDVGPLTIRPRRGAVSFYGEMSVARVGHQGPPPFKDTFPLQAKRPLLMSVPALLRAGVTYTVRFGVVIEMAASASEVYAEVIAATRYAERRPLRVI